MKIYIKRLFNLSMEETTFIFSMMRKYGGMGNPSLEIETNRRNGNNKKHQRKTISSPCDPNVPSLYDFNCKKWDTCVDDKFLQYRLIMEKLNKE